MRIIKLSFVFFTEVHADILEHPCNKSGSNTTPTEISMEGIHVSLFTLNVALLRRALCDLGSKYLNAERL